MVAPENVVFEAQFNIFYFMEKSHSVLEISIFYILNQFVNFESCDVMMSNSTRVRLDLFKSFRSF